MYVLLDRQTTALMYKRMYVCTYVRMYVCTYVCVYVCMWSTHHQAHVAICLTGTPALNRPVELFTQLKVSLY